jgi:hypothetical protein
VKTSYAKNTNFGKRNLKKKKQIRIMFGSNYDPNEMIKNDMLNIVA